MIKKKNHSLVENESTEKIKMKTWERFYNWFEKQRIITIFGIWILIIIIFGAIYLYVGSDNGLIYTVTGEHVTSIQDALYFSIITATSTGYGDIVPLGANKLISFVEIIIGLIVFALITSKIVGIKQERILHEIYDISLNEKINRIRSSLYLYRADINKISVQLEEKRMRRRELADMWTLANYFEQRIIEIEDMFIEDKYQYTKGIDHINAKLLSNSIVHSMAKTHELLEDLEESKLEWKRQVTILAFEDVCTHASKALTKIRECQHEKHSFKEDFKQFSKHKEAVLDILHAENTKHKEK